MHRYLRSCLLWSLAPVLLTGCIGPWEGSPDDPAPAIPDVDQNATTTHEVFQGRIVCGVGTSAATLNPCFVAPGNHNVFPFQADSGLKTLFVALTWAPTTDPGKELHVVLETQWSDVTGQDVHRYGSAAGPPDLVLRIDDEDIADRERSWENISASLALQVRVFPAPIMPPSTVLVQDFDLHVVAFHEVRAAEDVDPFQFAS